MVELNQATAHVGIVEGAWSMITAGEYTKQAVTAV